MFAQVCTDEDPRALDRFYRTVRRKDLYRINPLQRFLNLYYDREITFTSWSSIEEKLLWLTDPEKFGTTMEIEKREGRYHSKDFIFYPSTPFASDIVQFLKYQKFHQETFRHMESHFEEGRSRNLEPYLNTFI